MHYLLDGDTLRKICARAARAVKQGTGATAWVMFDPALCRLVVIHRLKNDAACGFVSLGEFRKDRPISSITDDLVTALFKLRGDGLDLEILAPSPDIYDHL
jgi:hypothetical protein